MTALALILGHLVGDYLFQADWMAYNKARKDIVGWMTCLAHCAVYSLCMGLAFNFLTGISLGDAGLVAAIAFVAHFPIDKTSFAKVWMRAILGKGQNVGPNFDVQSMFYWFVYVVVDNTMHLVLMVAGLAWFIPELLR